MYGDVDEVFLSFSFLGTPARKLLRNRSLFLRFCGCILTIGGFIVSCRNAKDSKVGGISTFVYAMSLPRVLGHVGGFMHSELHTSRCTAQDRRTMRTPRRTFKVADTDLASLPCGTAELWFVSQIEQPPGVAQFALLDVEERARAETLQGVARARFVWMRATVRHLLGELLNTSAQAIWFEYGKHGKPVLGWPAAARRCSFSVSHSGDIGAVLLLLVPSDSEIAAPPIGVDVEYHQIRRFSALAHRYFLPSEQTRLAAAAEEGGREAEAEVFFRMWTKKEAWLKARGVGIVGGLDSVECAHEADTLMELQSPEGKAPRLYTVSDVLDLAFENYSAAVAIPHGMRLQVRDVSVTSWPYQLHGQPD